MNTRRTNKSNSDQESPVPDSHEVVATQPDQSVIPTSSNVASDTQQQAQDLDRDQQQLSTHAPSTQSEAGESHSVGRATEDKKKKGSTKDHSTSQSDSTRPSSLSNTGKVTSKSIAMMIRSPVPKLKFSKQTLKLKEQKVEPQPKQAVKPLLAETSPDFNLIDSFTKDSKSAMKPTKLVDTMPGGHQTPRGTQQQVFTLHQTTESGEPQEGLAQATATAPGPLGANQTTPQASQPAAQAAANDHFEPDYNEEEDPPAPRTEIVQATREPAAVTHPETSESEDEGDSDNSDHSRSNRHRHNHNDSDHSDRDEPLDTQRVEATNNTSNRGAANNRRTSSTNRHSDRADEEQSQESVDNSAGHDSSDSDDNQAEGNDEDGAQHEYNLNLPNIIATHASMGIIPVTATMSTIPAELASDIVHLDDLLDNTPTYDNYLRRLATLTIFRVVQRWYALGLHITAHPNQANRTEYLNKLDRGHAHIVAAKTREDNTTPLSEAQAEKFNLDEEKNLREAADTANGFITKKHMASQTHKRPQPNLIDTPGPAAQRIQAKEMLEAAKQRLPPPEAVRLRQEFTDLPDRQRFEFHHPQTPNFPAAMDLNAQIQPYMRYFNQADQAHILNNMTERRRAYIKAVLREHESSKQRRHMPLELVHILALYYEETTECLAFLTAIDNYLATNPSGSRINFPRFQMEYNPFAPAFIQARTHVSDQLGLVPLFIRQELLQSSRTLTLPPLSHPTSGYRGSDKAPNAGNAMPAPTHNSRAGPSERRGRSPDNRRDNRRHEPRQSRERERSQDSRRTEPRRSRDSSYDSRHSHDSRQDRDSRRTSNSQRNQPDRKSNNRSGQAAQPTHNSLHHREEYQPSLPGRSSSGEMDEGSDHNRQSYSPNPRSTNGPPQTAPQANQLGALPAAPSAPAVSAPSAWHYTPHEGGPAPPDDPHRYGYDLTLASEAQLRRADYLLHQDTTRRVTQHNKNLLLMDIMREDDEYQQAQRNAYAPANSAGSTNTRQPLPQGTTTDYPTADQRTRAIVRLEKIKRIPITEESLRRELAEVIQEENLVANYKPPPITTPTSHAELRKAASGSAKLDSQVVRRRAHYTKHNPDENAQEFSSADWYNLDLIQEDPCTGAWFSGDGVLVDDDDLWASPNHEYREIIHNGQRCYRRIHPRYSESNNPAPKREAPARTAPARDIRDIKSRSHHDDDDRSPLHKQPRDDEDHGDRRGGGAFTGGGTSGGIPVKAASRGTTIPGKPSQPSAPSNSTYPISSIQSVDPEQIVAEESEINHFLSGGMTDEEFNKFQQSRTYKQVASFVAPESVAEARQTEPPAGADKPRCYECIINDVHVRCNHCLFEPINENKPLNYRFKTRLVDEGIWSGKASDAITFNELTESYEDADGMERDLTVLNDASNQICGTWYLNSDKRKSPPKSEERKSSSQTKKSDTRIGAAATTKEPTLLEELRSSEQNRLADESFELDNATSHHSSSSAPQPSQSKVQGAVNKLATTAGKSVTVKPVVTTSSSTKEELPFSTVKSKSREAPTKVVVKQASTKSSATSAFVIPTKPSRFSPIALDHEEQTTQSILRSNVAPKTTKSEIQASEAANYSDYSPIPAIASDDDHFRSCFADDHYRADTPEQDVESIKASDSEQSQASSDTASDNKTKKPTKPSKGERLKLRSKALGASKNSAIELEDTQQTQPASWEIEIVRHIKTTGTDQGTLPRSLPSHLRQSLIAHAHNAPTGSVWPTLSIAEALEDNLRLLTDHCEYSKLHPDGMGLQWKTTLSPSLQVKSRRTIYMGIIRDISELQDMPFNETRYALTILHGKRFIDGSGRYPEGRFKGYEMTTSLINSYRWSEDDKPMNNAKFMSPTKDDIGEIEITSFRPGREICVHYGEHYDFTSAKVEVCMAMVHTIHQVLDQVPQMRTTKRWNLLRELQQRWQFNGVNTYKIMLKIINTGKSRSLTNPFDKECCTMVSLVEGLYETLPEHKSIVATFGTAPARIHFPHHIYQYADFRTAVNFKNYGRPGGPQIPDLLIQGAIRRMVETNRYNPILPTPTPDGADDVQIESPYSALHITPPKRPSVPSVEDLCTITREERRAEKHLRHYVQSKGVKHAQEMPNAFAVITQLLTQIHKTCNKFNILPNNAINELGSLLKQVDAIRTPKKKIPPKYTLLSAQERKVRRHSLQPTSSGGSSGGSSDDDSSDDSHASKPAGKAESNDDAWQTASDSDEDNEANISSHSGRSTGHSRRKSNKDSKPDTPTNKGSDKPVSNTKRASNRAPMYWEDRPIPAGYEYRYSGAVDVKRGVLHHKWPITKVSKSCVPVNEILDPIWNFNPMVINSLKRWDTALTTSEFLSEKGWIFNGEKVFDWMQKYIQVNALKNIHTLAAIKALATGHLMEEGVAEYVRAQRICRQDDPAFIEIHDSTNIELIVRWLESFIMFMLHRYGQNIEIKSAQDKINKLYLKTHNMLGVFDLWMEVRQLQRRLPPQERTFVQAVRYLESAIERCTWPNKTPEEIMSAFNDMKTLIAGLLPTRYDQVAFDAIEDDQVKFAYYDTLFRSMEAHCQYARHSIVFYPPPPDVDDSTQERAPQKGTKLSIKQTTLDHSTNAPDDDEDEDDPAVREFMRRFDASYHDKDRNGGINVKVGTLLNNFNAKYNNDHLRVRAAMINEIPRPQRVICEACSYSGHAIGQCNVCDNGIITAALLARLSPERAAKRMHSSSTRNGQLSTKSARELRSLQEEVKRIREQNQQDNASQDATNGNNGNDPSGGNANGGSNNRDGNNRGGRGNGHRGRGGRGSGRGGGKNSREQTEYKHDTAPYKENDAPVSKAHNPLDINVAKNKVISDYQTRSSSKQKVQQSRTEPATEPKAPRVSPKAANKVISDVTVKEPKSAKPVKQSAKEWRDKQNAFQSNIENSNAFTEPTTTPPYKRGKNGTNSTKLDSDMHDRDRSTDNDNPNPDNESGKASVKQGTKLPSDTESPIPQQQKGILSRATSSKKHIGADAMAAGEFITINSPRDQTRRSEIDELIRETKETIALAKPKPAQPKQRQPKKQHTNWASASSSSSEDEEDDEIDDNTPTDEMAREACSREDQSPTEEFPREVMHKILQIAAQQPHEKRLDIQVADTEPPKERATSPSDETKESEESDYQAQLEYHALIRETNTLSIQAMYQADWSKASVATSMPKLVVCPESLTPEIPTNNDALSFMKMILSKSHSRSDAEYTQSVCTAVAGDNKQLRFNPDLSLASNPKFVTLAAQYDNGAGTSCISADLARRLDLVIQKRECPISVNGFHKGSTITIHSFVEVVIQVEGRNKHNILCRRRFRTQALVSDIMSSDFLFGSDVANKHKVCVDSDTDTATMFRGNDVLIIPCMNLRKLTRYIIARDAIMNQVDVKGASLNQELQKPKYEVLRESITDSINARALCPAESADLADDCIFKLVVADIPLFASMCEDLTDPIFMGAIAVVAMHIHGSHLRDSVQQVSQRIFLTEPHLALITPEELHQLISQNEMFKHKLQLVTMLTIAELNNPNNSIVEQGRISICSASEISDAFNEKVQQEQAELLVSIQAIQSYTELYLTKLAPELKPVDFPAEFWPLVHDDQKHLIIGRWQSFDINPVRKAEIIQSIMKMDICTDTEARRLEAPYVRAMLLANIDRFAHPDAYQQPRVRGREFPIELYPNTGRPEAAGYQDFDIWKKQFLRYKIEEMMQQGRVERSKSPWNARLVLVPKNEIIRKFISDNQGHVIEALRDEKNRAVVKTFFRLTQDYRNLNQRTVPMIYPLPSIPEIRDRCAGSGRYSTGDVEDAFFTVALAPTSREYTVFSTHEGHFHMCVMPQGARNAATFFAEIIADAFRAMLNAGDKISPFQDDINNFAKEFADHLLTQQRVFDVLRLYDLIFKISKSHFNHQAMRILGNIMSSLGYSVDPKTVEAVVKLRVPQTQTEVRSVVGLFRYAAIFIPKLGTVMGPITDLLKKGVNVVKQWKPEIHGVAFDALKVILTSAPVLLTPDITKPFIVQIDTCRVERGIGCILQQKDPQGVVHPCAYFSRSLSDAERKYGATMLECIGLHDSLLHFKNYLNNGYEFEVVCDCWALVYMVTKSGASEQQNQILTRLCLGVQHMNFSVRHIAGTENFAADAVSRLLRTGEEYHILTADQLCDDYGPLTEEEKVYVHQTWDTDADDLIRVIEGHRADRRRAIEQDEEVTRMEVEAQTVQAFKHTSAQQPGVEQEGMRVYEQITHNDRSDVIDVSTIACGLCCNPVKTATYSESVSIQQLHTSTPPRASGHSTQPTPPSQLHNILVCEHPECLANNQTYHQTQANRGLRYSPRALAQATADSAAEQYRPLPYDTTNRYMEYDERIRTDMGKIHAAQERFFSSCHTQDGHKDANLLANRIRYVVVNSYVVTVAEFCQPTMAAKSYEVPHIAELASASLRVALNDPLVCPSFRHYLAGELDKRKAHQDYPTEYESAPTSMLEQRLRQLQTEAPLLERYELYRDQGGIMPNELDIYLELYKRGFRREGPEAWNAFKQLRLHEYERTLSTEEVVHQFDELLTKYPRVRVIYNQFQSLQESIQKQLTSLIAQHDATQPPLGATIYGDASLEIKLTALRKKQRGSRRPKGQKSTLTTKQLRALEDVSKLKSRKQKDIQANERSLYQQTRQAKQLRESILIGKRSMQRLRRNEKLIKEGKRVPKSTTVEDTEELRVNEINRLLGEKYDCLISQCYIHPERQQPYQITDVRYDDERKIFVSNAVELTDSSRGENPQYDERDIEPVIRNGIVISQGVVPLVEKYLEDRDGPIEDPLPTTPKEWREAQMQDEEARSYIDKILACRGNAIIPLDGKSGTESEEYLYIHRSIKDLQEQQINGSRPEGPLRRRFPMLRTLHRGKVTVTIKEEYSQIFVPKKFVRKLMWHMHDMMGHPGTNRTLATLRMEFYFPRMYSVVKGHCGACRFCHLRKANNNRPKPTIQSYNISDRINSRLHFDLGGPYTETPRGMCYIAVLKCAQSKRVCLVPINGKQMENTTTVFLQNWAATFGPPEALITDRGTEFCNQIADEICELFDCKKISTTPRNPRSDGQVENFMRTFKDMLSAFTKQFTDWDLYPWLIQWLYNTTVNAATGLTPHYLTFGTESKSPTDEYVSSLNINEFHAMAHTQAEIMEWYRKYNALTIQENQTRFNRTPVEKLQYKPMKVGEFFFMRVVPKVTFTSRDEEQAYRVRAELQYRYAGPFCITKVLNPVLFEATIHGKPRVVHAINIKPAGKSREIFDRFPAGADQANGINVSVAFCPLIPRTPKWRDSDTLGTNPKPTCC